MGRHANRTRAKRGRQLDILASANEVAILPDAGKARLAFLRRLVKAGKIRPAGVQS